VHRGQLSKSVTGRIWQAKVGPSDKNVKIMQIEQRYVIKFLSDEGIQGVQIVARLRQHSVERALS
jgi:hypothetical protein